MLRACEHTNVCHLFFSTDGPSPGTAALLLEYCDISLHPVRSLQLDIRHIKSIAKQLLTGVAHIHACGVLHRDIKPQNVLLNHSGVVKIGDFGLASRTTDLRLADQPQLVTTVNYRAPELLHECTTHG